LLFPRNSEGAMVLANEGLISFGRVSKLLLMKPKPLDFKEPIFS